MDPKVLLILAAKYQEGDGVDKDFGKAVELYREAADAGHAGAQWTLGDILLHGRHGMQEDVQEAIIWFSKASAQDQMDATLVLGLLLKKGRGLSRNLPRAAELLQKAADHNVAQAQWVLAKMLRHGQGIDVDLVKAEQLLQAAVAQGHAQAQFSLALMYDDGLTRTAIEGPKTQDGHGPTEDVMVSLYRMSAHAGCTAAQHNLGYLYETGRFMDQDMASAAKWYTLAAEGGHEAAKNSLAFMYAQGRGVEQNDQEASDLFKPRNKAETMLFKSSFSPENMNQTQEAEALPTPYSPAYSCQIIHPSMMGYGNH